MCVGSLHGVLVCFVCLVRCVCCVFFSLFFFFFFFKQKTAYEMRISDWSSDVCSSDLSAGVLPMVSRPICSSRCCEAGRRRVAMMDWLSLSMAACGEIGRASCRERVCQYV